ncbi:hypothetical protein HRbin36_01314 [bacterium HR36]|nr:hypothetical protein HRbin36_01314 [bacterium HR36]
MLRTVSQAFSVALLFVAGMVAGCQDRSPGQQTHFPTTTPLGLASAPSKSSLKPPLAYGTEAKEWFFSTHVPVGPNVFVQIRQPAEAALREITSGALHSLGLRLVPCGLTPLAVLRSFVVRPGADRQVSVAAMVVLRHGYLEHLLTTQAAGKNHESVLAADIDALHLHIALMAIGAKPGKPMEYREENGRRVFVPPQGERIAVRCAYRNNVGQLVIVPAQRWIRDVDKKQILQQDWVFAGSRFLDPLEPGEKPFFGANLGRVICVSNFSVALLDLPVRSTDQEAEGLLWEANTETIPPLKTPVSVLLSRLEK